MRKILSAHRDYSMTMRAVYCLAAWVMLAVPAGAQYPGHVEKNKKAAASIRSIAVLEWTGDAGKPTASRVIPISVFDGEAYQPGGLYLAKPEPLALEPGTEYELQDAGIAKGLFDIGSAQDMQGYWFGYGRWKPLISAPKRTKVAKQGTHPPQVVSDNSGRPTFKRRDNGGSDSSKQDSTGSGGSSSAPANPPPSAGDPDRPTLRKRSSAPAAAESSSSSEVAAPETPIGGADPDRPRMAHGQQTPTDSAPAQLTGVPSGLQQMIAVSDASDREVHPFVYLWADPADASKMKELMEVEAAKAVAASGPAPAVKAPVKPRGPRPSATTSAARRKAAVAAAPVAAPVFANEKFKAYELTYSGGATLVFSGEMTDQAGKVKYVTLIAQPDFNGVPRVIYKTVTDDDHLDQTPRMKLIDAVDARADNRGDLVFELRSLHDREFVIYRISGGLAEKVFGTGSLPNSNGQG
jgi:hypothetical protein